jgi:superfamily II DNA or RNA helicase
VAELAAVLGLAERHRAGWTWTVPADDGAVDVLLALAEHERRIQTEWEGRPPSVQRARADDVRIRVGTGRAWFEVDGSVDLDGVGSVALPEVLEAVREGRSFLTARSGALIRLADDLRQALAPVAVAEDDGRLGLVHAAALEHLVDAGAEVAGEVAFQASVARIRAAGDLSPDVPTSLRAELRDYQAEGFRWLARLATWAPGAVLADDMGLGKTVQAIALLLARGGPSIVVCPLSVVGNWEAELARFAPGLRVARYHGPDRAGRLEQVGADTVLLTTWDLLARDAAVLAQREFVTAVLDEAQAIKNAATRRAKATADLRAGFTVALTGTPVENRSEELWSLFRVVVPGLLGSEERFRKRFATGIERGDAAAREALAGLVRPFVLRRTKARVAPELPARTEVVLPVPLSSAERALYERVRLEAVTRTAQASGPTKRFEVFRWLTVLRQLACNARLVDRGSPIASSKLELLRRRVADLRAAGQRALVFSQFVGHLELVRDALLADGVRLRWLTGDQSDAERRREVAAFQGGDGDVFLISLGAGGTGLNLTAATYVFHLDPWWNPAKEDQASDRTHRIGQTQPVTVYRLVAQGTIEERILALHAEKRELADALLSGASASSRITTEELVGLLVAEQGVVVGPDPSPPEPAPIPLPSPAELLHLYERSLERAWSAGELKTPYAIPTYVELARRLLDTVPEPTADALSAAADRHVAGLADGSTGIPGERTYARHAFRRLIALVADQGATAK